MLMCILIINIILLPLLDLIIFLTMYNNIINNDIITTNITCKIIYSQSYTYQRYSCMNDINYIDYVNTTIYIYDVEVQDHQLKYYAQGCASYLAFTPYSSKWDCVNYPYIRTLTTNGVPMWLCNQCFNQTCSEYANFKITRCYVTKLPTHNN